MADRITTRPITASKVERREAEDGFAREIVNGEWVEEIQVAGQKHSLIAGRLYMHLMNFVTDKKLGQVYFDGLNYVLEGSPGKIVTMRVPDISFVAEARVDRNLKSYYYLAPDLAIEIISPSERPPTTHGKIADYLKHGTKQVWVIDTEARQVTVHRPNIDSQFYGIDDTLPGSYVLPGFELPISTIFE